MHSIMGNKICQCVFHTGATGVKSMYPIHVFFFCIQVFAQSLNQGGGVLKNAKNLSKNMSDIYWIYAFDSTEHVKSVYIKKMRFLSFFSFNQSNVFPVFKWRLREESVFIHTTASPGVSTWLLVSPQPEKAPPVGGGLSIVI